MTQYLLDEILKYTKSKKSLPFYKNAIKELGAGIVEGELGELKYQIRTGDVNHPAKYFNKLLQVQLKKHGVKDIKKTIPKNTYRELTQQNLFGNLIPVNIPVGSIPDKRKMLQPYFRGQIPFPTFIGQEFFATSKNKKTSDTVIYKTETKDGKKVEVTLIRGKSRPRDKAVGIPTVYHGKLFVALIKAWTDKGSQVLEHKDGTVVCFVRVPARELAGYLGWKKFGGSQLEQLNTTLRELNSYPYYYRLEELDLGLKGFGFYLLGDVRIIDAGKGKTAETIFEVMFSTTVSKQLDDRKSISKSDGLLTIRNEIAWKLRLYLEPRLLYIPNDVYSINLENLIKELQLPPSSKHKYKSKRKNLFLKSVEEINTSKTTDGRIIKLKIILNKDKADYKLIAFLEAPEQEYLEV
ncbi:MAG: hypothetical protein PF545_07360 [Elusimicrobia bacterium]|jgi:hypothetical protein|nr:hypothetical protein [Elusimicrobiota bacterium]